MIKMRDFIWRTRNIMRRMRGFDTLGKGRFAIMANAVKINLRDGMQVVGKLDYPDEDLRVDAGSYTLVNRTKACFKEPENVEWIREVMRPGDVFYDIGANIGAYSMIAWARSGKNCRVYAFEPGFSNFATLCTNIYLNKCADHIFAFPVSLTEKTGMFNFNYTAIQPGRARHFLETAEDTPHQAERYVYRHPVLSFRLDDFIKLFNIPWPNHMKIDVDGGEPGVLAGAKKTLSHPHLRSIFIEVGNRKEDRDGIFSTLEHYGFRMARKFPKELGTNCIFMKKGGVPNG